MNTAHEQAAAAVAALSGPRYGYQKSRTRQLTAASLANAFAADPAFDRVAFMAACGVSDIEAD